MSSRNCRLLTLLYNNNIKKLKIPHNQTKYVGPDSFMHSRPLSTSSYLLAKFSFNLSDIGEGIREVSVKEWYVKVGDKVKQFDNICEVQSDKASVTITSRYDGIITKLHYKVDEIALVGKPLVDIETPDEVDDDETPPSPSPSSSSASSSDEEDRLPTKSNIPVVQEILDKVATLKKELAIPSVRRLAKENNIDLSMILGTGKGGRILKEDVLRYLEKKPATALAPSGKDEVVPIKGFQRIMVKTMTESLKIPSFGYKEEISLRNLSQVRKTINAELASQQMKISFMPFFIKAASNALTRYPVINASVDENCENVIYKSAHNIAVAMDTKVGLAVPVIKNVQTLSIMEIHSELLRLSQSGKEGNFNPADLAGGTFTLSNIGIIGGTYTKPVILPPQVAIVAFGKAKILPRFDSEMKVIADEIVCASGTADHRVIDGATFAKFIDHFKKQIENPNLLFLNL